jgi:type IV pilus assembly protein PilE
MNPAQPPTRRTRVNANRRGFGLLELMIAMLVVAVLLGLAIPSYRQYVSRAHRAEAVRTLLAAASCQERIRAQSGYYDTARCASGLADRCGSLTLNHAGTRAVSADGASVADCWGGR